MRRLVLKDRKFCVFDRRLVVDNGDGAPCVCGPTDTPDTAYLRAVLCDDQTCPDGLSPPFIIFVQVRLVPDSDPPIPDLDGAVVQPVGGGPCYQLEPDRLYFCDTDADLLDGEFFLRLGLYVFLSGCDQCGAGAPCDGECDCPIVTVSCEQIPGEPPTCGPPGVYQFCADTRTGTRRITQYGQATDSCGVWKVGNIPNDQNPCFGPCDGSQGSYSVSAYEYRSEIASGVTPGSGTTQTIERTKGFCDDNETSSNETVAGGTPALIPCSALGPIVPQPVFSFGFGGTPCEPGTEPACNGSCNSESLTDLGGGGFSQTLQRTSWSTVWGPISSSRRIVSEILQIVQEPEPSGGFFNSLQRTVYYEVSFREETYSFGFSCNGEQTAGGSVGPTGGTGDVIDCDVPDPFDLPFDPAFLPTIPPGEDGPLTEFPATPFGAASPVGSPPPQSILGPLVGELFRRLREAL